MEKYTGKETAEDFAQYLQLKVQVGSTPRGLNVTQSDVDQGLATKISDLDTRGFFLPTLSYYFPYGLVEDHYDGEGDTKYYEVNRFLSLLMKPSPEHIEMLFVDNQYVLQQGVLGKFLRQPRIRNSFLSKELVVKLLQSSFGEWQQSESQLRKNDLVESNKSMSNAVRRAILALHLAEENELLVHLGENVDYLRMVRFGKISRNDAISYRAGLEKMTNEVLERKCYLPEKYDEEVAMEFLRECRLLVLQNS